MSDGPIVDQIEIAMARGDGAEKLLEQILAHFDGQSGTIHRFDESSATLHLAAQIGVPDVVLNKVLVIPIGKGIAGAAALERRPVTICNIQTDTSGVAKPDAKLTGMAGALAVPILIDGKLYGTLGVGKRAEHAWSDAEIHEIEQIAVRVGSLFKDTGAAG